MKSFGVVAILIVGFLLHSPAINGQSIPSVDEVRNFFINQNILISYREGEVIYGTYYFMEIHYCPTGQYGLYGNTVKKTVLGNEQRSNWQEFGTWQVTSQSGQVGIYYATQTNQQFVPIYKLANGDFFVREGVSIVKQGPATCY